MRRFKRIAIIGVGLIGGSIGLFLRKKRLTKEVVGIGRKEISLKKAKAKGAIDKWTLDIKEGVRDADLIIVATPVDDIVKKVRLVFKYAKKGAVVTDVGSVKDKIITAIDKFAPKDKYFVGGHPLAGSEKRGPDFGSVELFRGCIVILAASKKTDRNALEKIRNFWKALGAGKVVVMDAKRHDAILAQVSHLPHLAAVSTCLSVSGLESLQFAASGFKDTTRVAASLPELWADIFLMNRKNMLTALDKYRKNVEVIKGLISKKDRKGLLRILAKAKAVRDSV